MSFLLMIFASIAAVVVVIGLFSWFLSIWIPWWASIIVAIVLQGLFAWFVVSLASGMSLGG